MDINPVSAALGLGNLLFGAGDRARQQTREHQAAMLQADQTRMSPWLEHAKGANDSVAAQAKNLLQKQEDPMGAIAGGATSLWAQLQNDQKAEDAKEAALKRQQVDDAFKQRELDILEKKYGR